MAPLTEIFGFPPSGTISPSVRLLEKDFSAYNPGGSFSRTGFIGFASKGPINEPVQVTNHDELFRKFGFPDPSTDHGSYLVYSANEFLRFGTEAWIVRVGVTDESDWDNFAKTAFVEIPASGQPAIIRSTRKTSDAGAPPPPFSINDDPTAGPVNNQFRFSVNGELFTRAVTIPVDDGSGYTVEQIVDIFNGLLVDADGMEAFIYSDGGEDTLAFRTTKLFGEEASIEIISSENASYDELGIAIGMTAAVLEGENDRWPEGSSITGFNFGGLENPTLKIRVVGTGNDAIDNIEQTIPFDDLVDSVIIGKTNEAGPLSTPIVGPVVSAADIATFINWWIDNPDSHTFTVPGGFRAEEVGGMVNLVTASTTAAPPDPLSNDIRGRTAQVQAKFNSNAVDEILGLSNNSAFGTTPEGVSTNDFVAATVDNGSGSFIDDVGLATGSPFPSGSEPTIMTIWAESPGLAGNSTQVTVTTDSDGKIILSVFNGGVSVEEHSNLDRDFASTNNPFYIERYINGFSDYIFIEDDSDIVGLPLEGTYSLGATPDTQGSDGYPFDDNGLPDMEAIDDLVVGDARFGTGIQAFNEPEKLDIDIIAAPALFSTEVTFALISLCELQRRDCMAIIDPPFGLDSVSVKKWHNGAHPLNTRKFDTSFAALYWPWIKVRDPFNQLDVWLPPSGLVAGVYAQSERISNVWFAPAGLRRGKIFSGIEVERFASLTERDDLYGNRNAVNTIVDFPIDGIHVFGQKTLQRRATALDRVNVRRLMLFLEKEVKRVSRFLLFEPHDEQLRSEFVRLADNILTDVRDNRGVFNYIIKCDEELNPPEVIDRNEMRARIGVQPIKAAEFIFITFTIHRTGSFEESVII
jgi:hypothetical protein